MDIISGKPIKCNNFTLINNWFSDADVYHMIIMIGDDFNNEPYLKLRHRHKNGCYGVGKFVKFVWAAMGRKFLNGNISAKKEDIKL